MVAFPKSMHRLVVGLSKLPSIGEKSASRLAYHLVNNDKKLAREISEALTQAVNSVQLCQRCFFLTEEPLCSVCANDSRDPTVLCVVEKPMDLIAIERTAEYRGYYHVLHGVWAPLRGKGPESMKIRELSERVAEGVIKEVIFTFYMRFI